MNICCRHLVEPTMGRAADASSKFVVRVKSNDASIEYCLRPNLIADVSCRWELNLFGFKERVHIYVNVAHSNYLLTYIIHNGVHSFLEMAVFSFHFNYSRYLIIQIDSTIIRMNCPNKWAAWVWVCPDISKTKTISKSSQLTLFIEVLVYKPRNEDKASRWHVAWAQWSDMWISKHY